MTLSLNDDGTAARLLGFPARLLQPAAVQLAAACRFRCSGAVLAVPVPVLRFGVFLVRHSAVPAYLERFFGGLLGPGLENDSRLARRHSVFLAVHLCIGFGAMALLPVALALDLSAQGMPRLFTVLTLCTAGLYALAGLSLALKPRLDHALYASASVTAVLVAWLADWSGGSASPAWPLMVLVPATVSLSRDGRAVALSCLGTLALMALSAVFSMGLPHAMAFAQLAPELAAAVAVCGTGWLCTVSERMSRADIADLRARAAASSQVAALASGLVTFHDRRGDVTGATAAAEAVLEATPDSLAGSGLYERIHPGDRPHYLLALADAVNGRARDIELRMFAGPVPRTAADGPGEMRTMAASFAPGALADPDCHAAVVLRLADISGNKALAARVSDLEEAQAGMPEVVASFLRRLSHDFRSPLNAVIGFSDLLAQEVFGRLETDRQREYVRLINDSGQHLLEMIEQSADYARLETGNFELDEERIPSVSILRAAIEQVAPRAANSGIEIVAEISPSLPDIVTDRRAFRHMAEALLWHGAKKLPSGSRLGFFAHAETGLMSIAVADLRPNPASLDTGGETTLPLELARRFAQRLGGACASERDLRGRPRLIIRLPLGRPAVDSVPGKVYELSASRLVS